MNAQRGTAWASLASAERLAAIIDSSGDAIVGSTLDGRIVTWNTGATALFGYTEAQALGQPVAMLLLPERQGEEVDMRQRIAAGERMPHCETVRLHANGRRLEVSVSISPVRDQDGVVVGALTTARDIGELVALRQREQRRREFMRVRRQHMAGAFPGTGDPVPALLEQLCQSFVRLGDAVAATIVTQEPHGPTTQARAGQPLPPASALLSTDSALQALLSGPPGAAQVLQAQGIAAVAFARHSPALQGDGLLLVWPAHPSDEAMLALMQDVAAEAAFLLRVQARDREFETIVGAAMDAIVVVDANQCIRRFNPAAEAMFGRTAESVLGQHLHLLIPARFHDSHDGHVQRFGTQRIGTRRMSQARPVLALRADGSEFPIEATVSHFGDAHPRRSMVVLRDVTVQREHEATQRARAVAEAASQAKSAFLTHLSHELRTPLNAVLGFSQLLLSTPPHALTDAQRRQVAHIRNAGNHLLTLVSDLLDMARIEAGQLGLHLGRVNLQTLLSEVLDIAGPAAQAANVQLVWADSMAIDVWADVTRLRQVLFNLVSNAVKYNRDGGQVRLSVRSANTEGSAERGEFAVVQVVDQGAGLSPAQLAKLFQPFERLGAETRQVEGAGMGLIISRQLVEQMNGRLQMESTPGQGTTVTLTLPTMATVPGHPMADLAAPAAAPNGTLPEPPQGNGALAPRRPEGTVLSVEDNPVNQLLVELLFSRWPDVHLLQASNGLDGLALARQHRPHLVLLDLQLPDMTGFEFVSALRANPLTQGLRVVAVSASAMPEERNRAQAMGMLGYLTKPLDMAPFLTQLSTWLAGPTPPEQP